MSLYLLSLHRAILTTTALSLILFSSVLAQDSASVTQAPKWEGYVEDEALVFVPVLQGDKSCCSWIFAAALMMPIARR